MSAMSTSPVVNPVAQLAAGTGPSNASSGAGGGAEPGGFARELERAHQGRDQADSRQHAEPARPGAGARSAEARTNEARTNEARTTEARTTEARAGQTRAGETRAAAARAADAEADAAAAAGAARLSVEPGADLRAAADAARGVEPVAGEDLPDAEVPALDMSALLAAWAAPAPPPAQAPRAAPAAADAAAVGVDTDAFTATAGSGRAAPDLAAGIGAAALPPGDAQAETRATPALPGAEGFVLPAALPAGAAGVAGGAALAAPAQAEARAVPMAESQIAAPLGSPGFAPALGAEVSLFVKDGVQQARLHLNPAEMGPITVQIQIEGDRAQVTMAAEQAPTRQALEQALPTLAGALRESGLTLTGGGVFEQPRQPHDGQPAPATGGASRSNGDGDADDAAALAAARPAAARARGGIDVYA